MTTILKLLGTKADALAQIEKHPKLPPEDKAWLTAKVNKSPHALVSGAMALTEEGGLVVVNASVRAAR